MLLFNLIEFKFTIYTAIKTKKVYMLNGGSMET